MASEIGPYIEFEPGGLITAEGQNDMQGKIREDICTQVEEGVAGITDVNHAADSDTLGGQSSQELCEQFLEKALRETAPKLTKRLASRLSRILKKVVRR